MHFSSTLTINYSDVEDGQSSVYVEPGSTLNWGAGNIDADPLYVDADTFHLTWDSPCKDTGDNTAVTELYDIEGDPRISYGTVDMGADEFYRHLYFTGDATPGGSAALRFVGDPGAQVGFVFGFDIFDPPIPGAYGNWYMKPPMMLVLGLGPIPLNGVYVLPGSLPPTPAGPYTLYFQAMIDWELTNLCVMYVQ